MRPLKRIAAYAAVVVVSLVIALGLVEVLGRLVLSPLLVRYSTRQALRLELANPKDLGVASLYARATIEENEAIFEYLTRPEVVERWLPRRAA